MANLVLQNNTKAKSTDITLKVNGSSDWKISNNNGTFIINNINNLLSIDTDGNVKIYEGHLFLDGATTNSASNTTQLVFRQEQSDGSMLEHIALSSNDDAFIINPASNSTTSQVVFYLGADKTSTLPSGLTISGTNGLTVSKATKLNSTLTVKDTATMRSITPEANNTYNLGTSSVKWANAYATTFHGALSGNAASATKLATARTLTVGNTGKTFNGTADVSWSANEIGCLSLVQRGSEFANAADLNTIDYGNYFSNNSTKSATLSNGPITSAGFRLFHQRGYNGTAGIYDWQFAFTSSRVIYQRYRNGDGNWGNWGTFIIKHEDGAVGSTTTPIYVNSNGETIACSTYAGGTKVTLNGTGKGGEAVSFYAPTGAGTSGYILKSSGSGAPTWAAVSNSEPTLAWGTTSTIGTVAGVALKVKMPANPNTDAKVLQSRSTATTYRALLLHQTDTSYGTDPGSATAGVYYNEQVAICPSTGQLRAISFRAEEGNISARSASTTARQVYAINTKGAVGILVNSSGNMGLYDQTNDKFLVYRNVADTTDLHIGPSYLYTNGVRPKTTNEWSCGTADYVWYGVSSRRFYLYDGTNADNYGRFIISEQGTTSTQGYASLYLGNNKAVKTAGGAYGRIMLYSSGTGYAILRATLDTTTETTHILPTTGGTLINSANYSTYCDDRYLKLSGGTLTGNCTISKSTTGETTFRVTNSNGSVGVHVSTNRGLYDFTESKWIIYSKKGESQVRTPGGLIVSYGSSYPSDPVAGQVFFKT